MWDTATCIQCNKCVMICPHSVIRSKVVEPALLANAPATFKSRNAITERDWKGQKFLLQVAPEDCTGCSLCVEICPARNKSEAKLKAINMRPQAPLRATERDNWDFFLDLPEYDRRKLKIERIRPVQIEQPLFEFSGACSDRGNALLEVVVANLGRPGVDRQRHGLFFDLRGQSAHHTWTKNKQGRGPAWSNSLFEDNAEFGLGFRLSLSQQEEMARDLLRKQSAHLGDDLVTGLLNAKQRDEAGIHEQRERVAALKEKLKGVNSLDARRLTDLADVPGPAKRLDRWW